MLSEIIHTDTVRLTRLWDLRSSYKVSVCGACVPWTRTNTGARWLLTVILYLLAFPLLIFFLQCNYWRVFSHISISAYISHSTHSSFLAFPDCFSCDNVNEVVMLLHGEPASSPDLLCLQMSWKGEEVATFLGDVLRWHGREGLICLHWSVLLVSSHPAREKERERDK